MPQMRPSKEGSEKGKYESLDTSFLDQGFYNNKGHLREELLDKEAKKLAVRFGRKGGDDEVSSAQLRRFFGDVRELETTLKGAGVNMRSEDRKDLEEHFAIIKMLKSKLAYAMGREVIPKSFGFALSKAVDQIKSPRDFKGFVLFFESIVGYYYGEGGGRIR